MILAKYLISIAATLIESKLEIEYKELQLSLIEEVKKNIAEVISTEIKEVIQKEIEESCMYSFTIPILQQHVKNLKQQNEILLQRCEKNDQYGRRLCMRIIGIPSQKNESADVRNSMKFVIEESECNIPDIALDCAHRIGRNDSSGKNVRLVIVRFTTFRHRTMFYRARKNLSKNGVHLDFTKRDSHYIRKLEIWSSRKKLLSMSMLM